jgi:hypothetical protein
MLNNKIIDFISLRIGEESKEKGLEDIKSTISFK